MKILTCDSINRTFFFSLQQGEIFGYSSAYNKSHVISLAEEYGITLAPPAKSSKEYKEHGEYVLKVKRIGIPVSRVIHQKEVLYKMERSKGARKCAGYQRAPHVIEKNDRCMVVTVPDVLPNGKRIAKKENYCLECARLTIDSVLNKYATFASYLKDE